MELLKISRNVWNNPRSSALIESLVGGPRRTALQGGQRKAPWAAASRGTLLGSSIEFREAFRAALVGMSSKAKIVGGAQIMFLELCDFRKRSETFEMTILESPLESIVGRPAGLCYRRGRHRAL